MPKGCQKIDIEEMKWAVKRTQTNKAMSADNIMQNLFKKK